MAKAQGFTCDLQACNTFKAVSGPDQLRPTGWLRLELSPVDETIKASDLTKDFCGEKCGEKFLKERRVALEGPRVVSSKVSPELRSWLAENGTTGHAIGAVCASHARSHQEKAKDECLVCQFEAAG